MILARFCVFENTHYITLCHGLFWLSFSVCMFLDTAHPILSSIMTLKSDLANIIEPDFGLLDQLLRLEVLSRRELADVRSEKTVYRRNDAMLDLLVSEDQCDKFMRALQRTGQQHIVNVVTQNGGQKHCKLSVR